MYRRAMYVVAMCVAAGLGVLSGVHVTSGPVMVSAPVAYAIDCQPVNDTCGQNDDTKTSVLAVSHAYVDYETPEYVEPDSGEAWSIAAEWRKEPDCLPGQYRIETASVRVDWNGSQWVLSDVDTTDNIVAISICSVGSCRDGTTMHGYAYKLIVSINDPENHNWYNLRQVTYTTTDVDGGTILALDGSTCGYGSGVTPTSQTFGDTDEPDDKWHSSRCPFSCDINGASVTIVYE